MIEKAWVAGGNFHWNGEYKIIQVKGDSTVGTYNHLPNWSTGKPHQNWNWKAILNLVLSQVSLHVCSILFFISELLIPHNSRSLTDVVAILVPMPHELPANTYHQLGNFFNPWGTDWTRSSFQIRPISNTYLGMGYSSQVSIPRPISCWERSCYSTN